MTRHDVGRIVNAIRDTALTEEEVAFLARHLIDQVHGVFSDTPYAKYERFRAIVRDLDRLYLSPLEDE